MLDRNQVLPAIRSAMRLQGIATYQVPAGASALQDHVFAHAGDAVVSFLIGHPSNGYPVSVGVLDRTRHPGMSRGTRLPVADQQVLYANPRNPKELAKFAKIVADRMKAAAKSSPFGTRAAILHLPCCDPLPAITLTSCDEPGLARVTGSVNAEGLKILNILFPGAFTEDEPDEPIFKHAEEENELEAKVHALTLLRGDENTRRYLSTRAKVPFPDLNWTRIREDAAAISGLRAAFAKISAL
jgi:hypothetical protein